MTDTDRRAGNLDPGPGCVIEHERAGPQITVRLPPVYLPMPLRIHPCLDTLAKRGEEFMSRHGFCDEPARRTQIADSKTSHFFGYLCPNADTDRLQIAVDWGYLMFVFDDVHCDGDTSGDNFMFLDLAVRFVRTLEAPDAGVLDPRHPFTGPVVELAERLHQTGHPIQQRRLVDAHLHWLLGVAWEIPAILRDARPPLNDYLLTRTMYSAPAPTFAWFQFSEPDPIPDTEICSQPVRALTEMAGAVACIDGDLYSFGKDQWLAHRTPVATLPIANVVNIYRAADTLNADQALVAAVRLRDRIVDRFLQLRDQVVPTASPALRRYLSNLTCLLRGNYEWGIAAGRYANPDGKHPGAVRTLGTITDTPAATGPPDIPTFQWWWR